MRQKHTILALDDNELTLRTYQLCFESAGYRVILSSTSSQAIDLAQQHRPELALIDINLSNQDSKDGYTVCRELLYGEHLPAVFLITAHARNAYDRLRAFEAGAIAFYNKFTPPLRLLEDVNFALRTPVPFFQLHGRTAAPAQNGGAPPSSQAPLRVVIIDDDRDQIEAISLALEEEGMEPHPAHNGRQGILLSYRVRPDAIILDMELPDMSGSETLAMLKTLAATKQIPVIIWTGSEKRGQELICMRDGAAQYLVKGIHEIPAIPLHVKACIRKQPRSDLGSLLLGPIMIEMSSRLVSVNGNRIDGLTSKEFALLAYVMSRSPKIVPWTDIERDVWNLPAVLQTQTHAPKTLTVHLNELKKKLGSSARCLVTYRGLGLQFDPSK